MDTPPVPDVEPGRLPSSWPLPWGGVAGPSFTVHAYNRDLLVIRQSGRTHFEKPFLYVLFGRDSTMLVDTGAPGAEVAGEIDRLLASRTDAGLPVPRALVVAHTHTHGDHVAGDSAFAVRPQTRLLGTSVDEVSAAFGIGSWPDGQGLIDLGGRAIDVIPIPGHDAASIAFYDRRTGILLAGDLLYPGRLYVRDAAAFRASVSRLVAFTRERPVSHILGAHIENTRTPYVDYPEGTVDQPDEHVLELGRAHLLELHDALDAMAPGIGRRRLRDFTVWPYS